MRGFLNHIWYKLLDEEGIPVSGATIFLYDYETTELNLVDSTGNNISQPLTTNSEGIFDFYVKDHIKANAEGGYGYEWDNKYIISWSKDDKSGLIANDNLFGSFRSVEISGSSTQLNRAISNYIGWALEYHANFMFGTTPRCGSTSSSSSSESSSSFSSSSSSFFSALPAFFESIPLSATGVTGGTSTTYG